MTVKVYEKSDASELRISHMEPHTGLLGPGDRFVIWVHGCCFDCPGCLAHNTRFGAYETFDTDTLCERIVESRCDGLTLSGGEPFLQAAALRQLIDAVRDRRALDVIVYSGFTLAELSAEDRFAPLLEVTDILIDGRYVRELDDGRPYIGSSNQVVHYLNPDCRAAGEAYYTTGGHRRAEIHFTPTQAVLIGVPSPATLAVWQQIKQKSEGTHHDF